MTFLIADTFTDSLVRRLDGAVERLIECAVNSQWCRYANGANGGAAGGIAGDYCRSNRRCGPIEVGGKGERNGRCRQRFSLAGVNGRSDRKNEGTGQNAGLDVSHTAG